MIVYCSKCGNTVVVNGLGRKRLNIPLKIICEALQTLGSVPAAAQDINCSEGYIYNNLKSNGLKVTDIIKGHMEPD